MSIRNASIFLFIAAIVTLSGELMRNVIMYFEIGSSVFLASVQGMLYTIARLLNPLLFLLIAVSYQRNPHASGSRKLLGIFLAVFSGLRLLMDTYTIYAMRQMNVEVLVQITNMLYLLSVAPVIIIGIAIYGTNKQFIRRAMIAGMITFPVLAGLIVYRVWQYYADNNEFFYDGIWKWLNIIDMLEVLFPVAQFLWALAVFRQLKQPIGENDLIDEL